MGKTRFLKEIEKWKQKFFEKNFNLQIYKKMCKGFLGFNRVFKN